MRAFLLLAALGGFSTLAVAAPPAAGADARVRLVLQVTVDQLRGDLPQRIRERWSRGGFRYLYENGTVFEDAHHGHANTETVVGHATLATGADPSVHGMVGNAWLDRETGQIRYNVEDPAYAIAGRGAPSAEAAGHPHVVQRTEGRSPEALLAPTLADAIAKAGQGRAEVWSLSLKDRSAIAMGGRSARTLWWSEASGEFVSSTWYWPDGRLPQWIVSWNDSHGPERLDGRTWELLHPRDTYLAAARDDMPWEEPPEGMGRTFPHRYDRATLGAGFEAAVVASPFGDELLLDFARELLRSTEIGRDDVVDYLSVAFSSLDLIGHRFGPSSLETEDALLRLDDVLARLLKAVEEEVGDDATLVVLSADHGVVEPPAEIAADGGDSGKVSLAEACSTAAVARLVAGAGCSIVRRTWPPYVYLDSAELESHGVDVERTAQALAAELAKTPGVAAVFTRGQIESGEAPDDLAARAVRRSFHPRRSGDVHVVVEPGWQLKYEGSSSVRFATGHGTPWRYDTFVPLVFAGPGITPRRVARRVETVDVAPTIAAVAGVPAPEKATGLVLPEVAPAPAR